MQSIPAGRVARKFSYEEFRNFVIKLSEDNSTTGEYTRERIDATKLNAVRMKRVEKQVVIRRELEELVKKMNVKWRWIVLAESWCGDGAQSIPVIAKIAALNCNIKLEIVLRDESPEFMNNYLTNGTRSIPKLVCFNSETEKEIGIWGPRPEKISRIVLEFRNNNPHVSHNEFVKHLHLLYAGDKSESVQEDFLKLIPEWIKSD